MARAKGKIPAKGVKLLWSLSGGVCAICGRELTPDKKDAGGPYVLGEQAHIVGEFSSDSRSNSNLTQKERNSYDNLILLCPTDHTVIDRDDTSYSVEGLHKIKLEHEQRMKLAKANFFDPLKQLERRVWALVINSAVENCQLGGWRDWTYDVLLRRYWPADILVRISEFWLTVQKAVWPASSPDLRRAAQTLAMVMIEVLDTLMSNAVTPPDKGIIRAYKGYRNWNLPSDEYPKLRKDFERWSIRTERLLIEATKAANWFADVVRRDVNPEFFILTGKFELPGPLDEYEGGVPEYTDAEKLKQPEAARRLRVRGEAQRRRE